LGNLAQCQFGKKQALSSTRGWEFTDKNGEWEILGADRTKSYLTSHWGKPEGKVRKSDSGEQWTKLTSGKCGVVAYLNPNDTTWHIGFFRDGFPLKDQFGSTGGEVPDGLLEIWYVPCKCETKVELMCSACKGKETLPNEDNKSTTDKSD